jgi:hypothetical protein
MKFIFPYASITDTDVQATVEAFSYQKRTSSTSNTALLSILMGLGAN